MKQNLLIIGLVVILTLLGIKTYLLYQDSKDMENLYHAALDSSKDWEDKYNAAKVVVVKEPPKINVRDPNLKSDVKREKIKEVHTVEYVVESTNTISIVYIPVTGTTEITQPIEFEDFRIKGQLDIQEKKFSYKLSQIFTLNIYEMKDFDYRVEILELDNKGNVLNTITPSKYTVIRVAEDTEKWWIELPILNIGGGYGTFQDLEHGPIVYAGINFIAYGKTHLDSTWRFGTINIGYPAYISITPVGYRIGEHLPLVEDVYIDTVIGTEFKRIYGGLAISSTF